MSLLIVRDLTVRDTRNNDILARNINFEIESNTCLGIVGESGSGKSITCKALLDLTNPWLEVSGTVIFDGIDLFRINKQELRRIRGKRICMILQDAMTAFNPLYTIGYQMCETLCEKADLDFKKAELTAAEALEKMRIYQPAAVMKKYPHQLSGGMLQRCMIALAMAIKPDIIIADEPTTALDSINQREVVQEFRRLRELTGTAVIFISHDLGVIQYLAQQILVMRNGEQVEYGTAKQIFTNAQNEYTRYLIETRIALTRSFHNVMKERCG